MSQSHSHRFRTLSKTEEGYSIYATKVVLPFVITTLSMIYPSYCHFAQVAAVLPSIPADRGGQVEAPPQTSPVGGAGTARRHSITKHPMGRRGRVIQGGDRDLSSVEPDETHCERWLQSWPPLLDLGDPLFQSDHTFQRSRLP